MKVFIIAAITTDGFIAKDATHVADWTSPEDKAHFKQLTQQAGVMVMGSRTFATIGRALPGRRTIAYTSRPQHVTTQGIETSNDEPATLVARLAQEGVPGIAICGGASIYSLFMRANVVDELFITVEPVLFGAGLTLFNADIQANLQLLDTKMLNDNTIVLHYKVLRGE